MEKHVENVENCELSTVISMLSPLGESCGKLCTGLCIKCWAEEGFEITSPGGIGAVKTRKIIKSLQNVKNKEMRLLQFVIKWQKFVENRQKIEGYHLSQAGNTFLVEILSSCGVIHRRMFQEAYMQGKVEICGVNTAKLPVLSQAEMDTLLRECRAGNPNAREMLIEGNLRLVLSVIQRFDKRGEAPDDLFQVGCIGLIKAIENFDPTKQVRFSTYGVPTVCECRNNL